MLKLCEVCGDPFEGRADRAWCVVACKKKLKSHYDQQLHLLNREKNIKRACDWQKNNRQHKSEYDRDRRIRFPEQAIEARRRYTPDPEERRLTAAKRRVTKRKQGSYLVTKRDLSRALSRASYRCQYCREGFTDANPLEWDHVIPIARGGTHSIGNLVPACKRCNRSKQVKFLVEWQAGRVVSVRRL